MSQVDILPNDTETDGLVLNQEQVNQMIAQTPLGRLGKPEDVASAVALLVSDDAHWVTGQGLRTNGGIV
jgi:3-oxoacyl-[acyl-carrier protein] reductase